MPADHLRLLRDIEERLKAPLPGLSAQLVMVPEPRPGHQTYQDVGDDCLKAAVLALLYPRAGRLTLLLTKRTEEVLHHRGQISLPGGEQHPGEDIVRTSLRETEEELGFPLAGARILGRLTPLYIPPSHYCIYPVVASIAEAPVFRPQKSEVAEVIELPLDHLLAAANSRRETWVIDGRDVIVPFFDFSGHKIWGATAMVLAELVKVCRSDTDP